MVLRPDLQRLKDDGMGLLSELAIDTEVVLRCFRTGGITHAGDRQVELAGASRVIDNVPLFTVDRRQSITQELLGVAS
jgi:hypothetical protein